MLDTEMPETFEDSSKHFVLLLEQYERVFEKVYVYREMMLDGNIQVISAKDRTPEEARQDLTPEQQQAIANDMAVWYEAQIPRIKVTTVINDKYELRKPYFIEIDNYPIIELRGEDTRNGEPRGEVDYLISNQEFMSKALNIVVGNAAMGSFLRYIADPTKLTEFMSKEQFQKAITEPGGILWMMQDSMNGKFPIDTIRPEPLNEAFVYLMNYMAHTMEYSLQQFGATMGDTSQAPRTFAATAQFGEWADESLVIPRDEIERGIQKLYDIFYQWAPSYYKSYKRFSTYDEDTEEEMTHEINKPNPNSQGLELLNNISNFRARYRIRKGSMSPSMSVAKLKMYSELLQTTGNMAFLLPLLEHLPAGKYKSQLRQTLNIVPQLQEQLQGAVEQTQQLEAELTRQTQQNIELQKRMAVDKTSAKVEKEANRTIFELRGMLRDVATDLKLLKERADSSAKTKE
jgi:hypothetical protein